MKKLKKEIFYIFQPLIQIYTRGSYWFTAGLLIEHISSVYYFLLSDLLQRSAQLKLQESHVVIVDSGTPLCDEIVKNLAMAGVGKLSILIDSSSPEDLRSSHKNKGSSLRSNDSLANYAKGLNPLMQVCAY